ncbi:CaiB/BaiF CoA transferase family protein [Nocardia sp. CA-151230]|uniref:CaiB/BaiF CoA transferase family protein n=1 Tax=Nocardia sp. CA-151230 TaxID=3239982 RepID=UPI003D93C132
MPSTDTPRPLDGFRVLDFTQNVAGPLAGQVLVDLGAEVIKIEAPGGEAARRITSVLPGRKPLATYFLPNNRGKKSVMVDLATEAGKDAVMRLADTADVILEAFRPGVMEKLGFGPDELRQRNPRLVYARLSAYGGNGPRSGRPGLDLMVQAESGMTTGLRRADGGPQIVPFQLVDGASGHVLAQAVLAALLNRERHGVADVVRVAMYDVAISLQANQLTLHLNKEPNSATAAPKPDAATGAKPRKQVAFATQPSEAFRAADGFLVLSAYVPKHWLKLCEVLGRPELADDERFTDQRLRSINFDELRTELEAALAARSAAEWVELLHAAGLMATLAYSWKQVVATELFAENELAVSVGDGASAVALIRTPARYQSFTAAGVTVPPAAGAHNDEFLAPTPAHR